jgi:hypothetical protein
MPLGVGKGTSTRPLVGLAFTAALLGGSALAPARSSTQAVPVGNGDAHAVGERAGATGDAQLASFDGSFALSGEASQRRAMEQAIDRVVDQMDLFVREIARLEIRRRVTPEQRIAFDVHGADRVSLTMDQWGPGPLTVGAAARRVRGSAGDDVNLSLRFRDGRLVTHSAASNGARTNTFSLDADGERLLMAVRITSDQLPADIRYTLAYRRSN